VAADWSDTVVRLEAELIDRVLKTHRVSAHITTLAHHIPVHLLGAAVGSTAVAPLSAIVHLIRLFVRYAHVDDDCPHNAEIPLFVGLYSKLLGELTRRAGFEFPVESVSRHVERFLNTADRLAFSPHFYCPQEPGKRSNASILHPPHYLHAPSDADDILVPSHPPPPTPLMEQVAPNWLRLWSSLSVNFEDTTWFNIFLAQILSNTYTSGGGGGGSASSSAATSPLVTGGCGNGVCKTDLVVQVIVRNTDLDSIMAVFFALVGLVTTGHVTSDPRKEYNEAGRPRSFTIRSSHCSCRYVYDDNGVEIVWKQTCTQSHIHFCSIDSSTEAAPTATTPATNQFFAAVARQCERTIQCRLIDDHHPLWADVRRIWSGLIQEWPAYLRYGKRVWQQTPFGNKREGVFRLLPPESDSYSQARRGERWRRARIKLGAAMRFKRTRRDKLSIAIDIASPVISGSPAETPDPFNVSAPPALFPQATLAHEFSQRNMMHAVDKKRMSRRAFSQTDIPVPTLSAQQYKPYIQEALEEIYQHSDDTVPVDWSDISDVIVWHLCGQASLNPVG